MTTKTIEIKDLEMKVFEMCNQIFDVLMEYDISIEEGIDITANISKKIVDVLELD